MKEFVKFIFFGLLAPIILIVLGALLAGWGLSAQSTVLIWAGIVVLGVGVLWGIFVFIWSDSGLDLFS